MNDEPSFEMEGSEDESEGQERRLFLGAWESGPLRRLPRQYSEALGLNLHRRPKPAFGSTAGVRGAVAGLIAGGRGAAAGSTGGVLLGAVGSIGGK